MNMVTFKFPEVVDIDLLVPNDYNPNVMQKTEFQLLKTCIVKYGFFFPIICNKEEGKYHIIDGEHRYKALRVLKSPSVLIINLDISRKDRMILTVLMNRIKGIHKVQSMSELVLSLREQGMNDVEVAKSLGMEAEEFIRLMQQLGVTAKYFQNHEYSNAWKVE